MENSLENVSLGPGSTVGEKGKHLPRLPSDSLRFRPCRFFSPFSPNEEPGPWLGEFVCGYRVNQKIHLIITSSLKALGYILTIDHTFYGFTSMITHAEY